MDNRGRGFKARPFKGRPVTQVPWLQIVGLLEEIVGCFVVLASLSVLSLGEQTLSLVGDSGQGHNRDQQQQ